MRDYTNACNVSALTIWYNARENIQDSGYLMIDNHLTEETWVNLTEGAHATGYSREYVFKLARRMWEQPEEERQIRVRKRSNGYEMWLPDLIAYAEKRGPYKRESD